MKEEARWSADGSAVKVTEDETDGVLQVILMRCATVVSVATVAYHGPYHHFVDDGVEIGIDRALSFCCPLSHPLVVQKNPTLSLKSSVAASLISRCHDHLF